MTMSSEWAVTYTKHKTQKRKVYHDGFLIAQLSNLNHKVLLYDDCRNLLESRYLKKHEKVECGEMLEFENFLVDIGEMENVKRCSEDGFSKSIPQPSRKEIDLKKVLKPSGCPEVELKAENNSYHLIQNKSKEEILVTKEWHAVFTSQKNKKVKRYQDGVVTVVSTGERQRQMILSTEDGNILQKKYLASDETVECNGTIDMQGYLVEILNPKFAEESTETLEKLDSNPSSSRLKTPFCKVLCNNRNNSSHAVSRNSFLGKTDEVEHNIGLSELACLKKQRRDVSEIISLLRGPSKDTDNLPDRGDATSNASFLSAMDLEKANFPAIANETEEAFVCGENCEASASLIPERTARKFLAPKVMFKVSEEQYIFPEESIIRNTRKVVIPDEFNSFIYYRSILVSAVKEEINLILHTIANEFHTANEKLARINKRRPSCTHGAASLQVVKKDGPNKGRLFYGCPSKVEFCLFVWVDTGNTAADNKRKSFPPNDELQHAFRCLNIDYFTDCELFTRIYQNYSSNKRKDEEAAPHNITKKSTYLKLGGIGNKNKLSHSKGDIWVISSNPSFRKEGREDFVAISVSQYHGPTADGILEVSFLESKPPTMPFRKAYALHGSSILCELTILDVIRNMHVDRIPLLPLLIEAPKVLSEKQKTKEAEELAEHFITKYQLNNDQAKILQVVARWFVYSKDSGKIALSTVPQICLVHGIFGSGKSFIVSVLVIFLVTFVKKQDGGKLRILISAATNVAVDRILEGLLELGFTEFIRVGSVKKIAAKILPFSVYTTSNEETLIEANMKELRERLCQASSFGRLEIVNELKALEEGKLAIRKEKLKCISVVGVTCFSTTKDILKGNTFQICILDECSQMPEPLSLLPICQFSCIKLVAVGDPCQLPPALLGGLDNYDADCETGEVAKSEESEQNIKRLNDLRRPLFVRLMEIGCELITLKTQYRCHPRLVRVPNDLFYGGKVVNGCRETDRPPLIERLPPLLFLNTCTVGDEIKDSSKSYSNQCEAKIVCELIKTMLEFGIPERQIGVIVFYKSQAILIQNLLCEICNIKACNGKGTKLRRLEDQRKVKMVSSNFLAENRHSVSEVQISTVDAFQGMEKSIIILSCCRTTGMGFLSSPNRLNVALTRARNHLLIVGKASNLKTNYYWSKLLDDVASTSGSYISCPQTVLDNVINFIVAHIKNPHAVDIPWISEIEPSGKRQLQIEESVKMSASNVHADPSEVNHGIIEMETVMSCENECFPPGDISDNNAPSDGYIFPTTPTSLKEDHSVIQISNLNGNNGSCLPQFDDDNCLCSTPINSDSEKQLNMPASIMMTDHPEADSESNTNADGSSEIAPTFNLGI